MCENMPSGKATKPGDVVTARNGKTIQVDNTDAEGRLILADALCLAAESPNRVILDMATLTGKEPDQNLTKQFLNSIQQAQ